MYWKMALSTNYRSVISIILARSDLSANYYAFLRLFRWSRPRVSVKLRIGFIKLILTGQTLIEFLQDLEWPKFKSGEPSWNDSFHYSHPFQYFRTGGSPYGEYSQTRFYFTSVPGQKNISTVKLWLNWKEIT